MHKAVLAARCEVFDRMFSHSTMKEHVDNKVDIPDIKPEIIQRFLEFIYTGRIKGNLQDVAGELLIAADKYSLETLKEACSRELVRSFTIENVSERLVLGDLHADHHLKTKALEFIANQPTDVMATEGWKKAVAPQLRLLNEAYTELARIRSSFM